MTTWPTKKLGEIVEFIYGNQNINKGKANFNGKYPAYSASGQDIFLDAYEHEGLAIIVSWIGARCGKCFLADGKWTSIANTQILKIKNENECDYKYLFYFLNDEKKWPRIGGAQPYISKNGAKRIEIPLPQLKIQKRIVARIEEFFEKIDKVKELREKAQGETEQIFQSALQKVFDKAEKKWGMKKLGEICCINPSKSELKNLSDNLEVSFIPMAAVDDISGSIITQEKKLLGKVKKGYTYFKEDDVLFAKITPCMQNGKSAIAKNLINGIGFGSTEFHVLRPLDKVLSKWIYFYIRQPWFRKEAERHFTGTAGQQRVPQEFIEKTEIPLPPLSEQKKIVAYLDDLREKVEKLKQLQQKQLEELNELKNSILEKAFKGELAE